MYNVCILLVRIRDFLTQLSELRILADPQSMKLLIILTKVYLSSAKKSQNGNIICINSSKNPIKKRNIIVNFVKNSFSVWSRTKKNQ